MWRLVWLTSLNQLGAAWEVSQSVEELLETAGSWRIWPSKWLQSSTAWLRSAGKEGWSLAEGSRLQAHVLGSPGSSCMLSVCFLGALNANFSAPLYSPTMTDWPLRNHELTWLFQPLGCFFGVVCHRDHELLIDDYVQFTNSCKYIFSFLPIKWFELLTIISPTRSLTLMSKIFISWKKFKTLIKASWSRCQVSYFPAWSLA